MRVRVSTASFRVVAGLNPLPVKLYEGEDIREALRVFYDALPAAAFVLRHDVHGVTGEPVIECRDTKTGLMAAALYGVTADEWNTALRNQGRAQ